MRFRSTVVLALILAGLVAYFYFVERERAAKEAETETLLALDADQVTGVRLTYGDRELALEKRDGRWRLTAPVDAAADQIVVANLLRAITDAEVKKTIDDPPADLAPFGLASPFVTITLTATDAEVPPIKVGKNTAVSMATYVQRADRPAVYLTGSGFRTGVDKQPKDLRDKTVVEFNEDEITAIVLREPTETVEIARQDGTWMIEQPAVQRADPAAVRAMLTTIRNLRATDFASDQPSPADLETYGLATPAREIVLRTSADREVRLRVGKETDQGLYVQAGDRPTAFVVGKWVAPDLSKGIAELRDKTLLAFDPATAGSITIARPDGGETVTLTAGENGWTVGGLHGTVNTDAVDAFVGALSRLAGTEVLAEAPSDLATYGLAPPALTITVTGKDGSTLGTLHAGMHTSNPPATEYTAQRAGDAAVLRLGEYQFKDIDKRAVDFAAADATPPAG